jgi:L-gulonate 3-dehydrogenase
MKTVAIIGSGLIGRAWACKFVNAGWSVRMYDTDMAALAFAPGLVAEELESLAQYGLAADPIGDAYHLSIAATIAEAVDGVDFVQENGPETLEVKTALYAELDRLAPPATVLASSTSTIVTSRFTENLHGRDRCLVGHPVNPPHLASVVELSGAPWTSAAAIDTAREVYLEIGQTPILVRKEIDGFILNRLQGALLAEAFRLVADGYVSPEDLDHTIKDGLGLRWSFMGPFETIELNAPGGVADYCARYAGVYRQLQANPAGPEVFQSPILDKVVAAWPHEGTPERIAKRTRWRNERLAALAAHKKHAVRDA